MSKVYLIGAGPGDEELLTLKGKRVLERCSAVLYDRLANDSLLKYLRDDCEVFYCGKEPGCHYKSQEEINEMLVKLAKEGHTVGRIKGGDPYVFGRGGEEVLRLIDEDIEFEVIPGITSAISVLNYAGIPATHRGLSQSFHVFTGKSAKKLNINWEAAAGLTGTLIFLMGLDNLEGIIENLVSNGKSIESSCAVIMRGTTSKQKKVVGKLSDISEKVRVAGLESPCIIVIGEVVTLNEKLNWYERKPLFGKNVCITRTKAQSKEISERLLDLGAEVTPIHTIEIRKTSDALKNYMEKLSEYKYIVLTSVNGVNAFFDYLNMADYDVRNIKGEFCSIGPATTKAIRARGVIPKITSGEFVAEALFEEMKKHVSKGDTVLIPRSKDARSFLVDELVKLGALVDEVHIYETQEGKIGNIDSFVDVDTVIFTSPSTVKNLISIVGLDNIKTKECIAIGPITGKELDKNNISYIMCEEYSTDGIINKLLELRRGNNDK